MVFINPCILQGAMMNILWVDKRGFALPLHLDDVMQWHHTGPVNTTHWHEHANMAACTGSVNVTLCTLNESIMKCLNKDIFSVSCIFASICKIIWISERVLEKKKNIQSKLNGSSTEMWYKADRAFEDLSRLRDSRIWLVLRFFTPYIKALWSFLWLLIL